GRGAGGGGVPPRGWRGPATAFIFNTPRLISWTGPLISGWLIANFGGFSQAAVVIATVYVLGLVAVFLPETRAKPLPEECALRHEAPSFLPGRLEDGGRVGEPDLLVLL